MSRPEDKILASLDNLIAQYESELDFLHNRNMTKFDTTALPQIVQDIIKLATAKTPSFSNVSATAVANFVLSHTFGQLRPVINDPIYSDDSIGINTYGIILSRSGCVDADTEFCTPNGWKRIADFQPHDLVLSWNSDGASQFMKPSRYIKGQADTLTQYKSGTVDMVLSDDHNMALLNTSGKYIQMTAGDFKQSHLSTARGSNLNLPFNFNWPKNTTGLSLTDNELRLFIAYVADGTIQNYGRDKTSELVRIRVKKQHKKERLRALLREVYGRVDERVTKSEPEYSRFYFPPIRGMTTKTLDDLWHLSAEQAEIAADEFWRWDGGIDKRNGSKIFRTTKKSEADLVQFIWQSVYDTVITMNVTERHDKTPFHTEYQVICTQRKSIGFRSQTPTNLITEVPTTDGYQYCFTMPNSNWVARRNNKIFLTKNSGKDSTYQAITKATQSAIGYINQQIQLEAEEKARAQYIKEMLKTNKDFDASTVQKDDYVDMVPKPEMAITSLDSTRGGITSSLNRMAKSQFSIKSLFASELGLAIQSNSEIVKILELFSILFDMGQSVCPEFKTADAKEESVDGMFPNLLGISSPAPFYQEGNVRKLLVPLLTTSLARRVTVVFSNASEEFENEYIPLTPAEKRALQADQRVILQEYTKNIDKQLLTAVKELHYDAAIMFDEEAAAIYDDYKSYTQELSKSLLLRDGDSVEGIEMSGRAFKMGRIAATWAVASNSRIIDAATLKAAIYFCDYTAQHLTRFAQTLELKDYELFINDWQNGFFDNVLPIDKAITRGYINVKQITNQSLTNFLKPVNSKLEGIATVSYNDKANAFIFVPAVKNLDAEYTYRACQGHVTTRPIANVAVDKPMSALGQLLEFHCSFNQFAQESAKFISFTVTESFLSMHQISKYLANTHHYIATTTDPSNQHAFTLILPLNTVISKSEYKYVAMSVANQLMLKVLPEHCEHDVISYGYANSTVLTAGPNATLFDCSGILGNLASGSDIPILATKPAAKPAPATVQKYIKDDILANKAVLIEMLDASHNPVLLFATVVYDMIVHGVDQQKVTDIIDSVNSQLIKSIPEHIKNELIIEPFVNL